MTGRFNNETISSFVAWIHRLCPRNPQNLSQSFHLKGVETCFFILSESPAFTAEQDDSTVLPARCIGSAEA